MGKDPLGLLKGARDGLGGVEPLAARLAVAASDLQAWLNAEASPPSEVLLRAIRVVVEERVLRMR